jgi:hypothetical protein
MDDAVGTTGPAPSGRTLLAPTAGSYLRLLGRALLAAMALRLLIAVVTLALAGQAPTPARLISDGYRDAPFWAITDIFADSLKSGMAQTAITAPLAHDPAIAAWNQVFRGFLLDNDYLKGGITIRQTPPLANLQLMAVAWGVVHGSPGLVAGVEIAVFVLLGWALSRHRAFTAHGGAPLRVWAILCLSYPALFMIDRGNFHSGMASLAVCTYLVTLFDQPRPSGARLRRLCRVIGMVVMAVAINYRPNLALLTLVEFTAAPLLRTGAMRIAMIGVITAALALVGYVVCHAVDPDYTLAAMVDGLDRYKSLMITQNGGLDWNASLFGVFEQGIASLPNGLRPATAESVLRINGQFFGVTMAACAGLGLAGVWSFATGRLRPLEAGFLLLAINMLGTPFYAEYHMLVYAAVLLLLPMDWRHGHLPVGRSTLILTCAVFAIGALVRSALPLSLPPFLLLLLVPCFAWRMALRQIADHDSAPAIMFVAAFLGLCSLGGRFSQGPLEAVSILIASGLLLRLILRRPAGTVRPALALPLRATPA